MVSGPKTPSNSAASRVGGGLEGELLVDGQIGWRRVGVGHGRLMDGSPARAGASRSMRSARSV